MTLFFFKKAKREFWKQLVMHKETHQEVFSAETLQARKQCSDIFKVVKEKNLPTSFYLEKLSFKNEG